MNESSERPAGQRFTLSAPPPVRALAISAGAAVVAVLLLVIWRVLDLPMVVGILGIVVLVLGVMLAVSAVVLTRRLRTTVTLTADSVAVDRGGRTESVAWAEVDEVALRGSRLVLLSKAGSTSASVVNPRPAGDPTFMSMVVAVQDRLNANRGYGGRPF